MLVAFYITIVQPGRGSDSLIFVFISGSLAISALILPGISGSFILLLLGMYTTVVPAVKSVLENQDTASLTTVLVFGTGCLAGLAAFSRVLSWTFRNYPGSTLALLTGFMLGSLNKIWPWRNVLEYRTDTRGEQVPLIEKNVMPAYYDGEPMVWQAVLCLLFGFALVFLLEWLGGEDDSFDDLTENSDA